ncbi:aminoglycoside phosphotransferase family protein [Naasia sp. SYSU D00948]|uniref:maltokinase N-terminal cap-like domain-containing protein n=1 Tax=Naasia sp. SYSU D00948 TaxID=2817379 RepID=UPI001FF04DB1|nr:aminoglycoside phosphotransferase family protein [Naasia sp. SYSU D00948]
MAASEGGAVDAALADWMTRQRWFSGKGGRPQLREVGSWTARTGDSQVTAEVLLVEDGTAGTLYQVPLVRRAQGDGARSPIADGDDRYDGPHEPEFAQALLELLTRGGEAEGSAARAVGEPAGPSAGRYRSSRVLSGEQSNTSIIIETQDDSGADSTPLIVKLFRTLSPGDNPDVVLQTAIAGAGSDRVPRSYGALRGTWGDGATGHLAFAQEFLPGTQDAWRVATTAVDADQDFTDAARRLGEATAEVHRVLSEALPTVEADEERKAALLASMRSRLAAAVEVVDGLEDRAADIDAVFEAAAAEPWPRLQRVHGDYHLGQVLHHPDRGWVLLDFEGEPLRPMEERSQPDLALRDVAGMLRSFDYAAGASRESHPGEEHARLTERWAGDARTAFLQGYEEALGEPLAPHSRLLAALELDKALYEAVYEARNRPDWLPIPAAAIARLAG